MLEPDHIGMAPYIHWRAFAESLVAYPMLERVLLLAFVFGVALYVTVRRSRGWRVIVLVSSLALLHPHQCTSMLLYKNKTVDVWQQQIEDRTMRAEDFRRLEMQVMAFWFNEAYHRFGWWFGVVDFVFAFLAIYAVKIPYRILRWGWRRRNAAQTG